MCAPRLSVATAGKAADGIIARRWRSLGALRGGFEYAPARTCTCTPRLRRFHRGAVDRYGRPRHGAPPEGGHPTCGHLTGTRGGGVPLCSCVLGRCWHDPQAAGIRRASHNGRGRACGERASRAPEAPQTQRTVLAWRARRVPCDHRSAGGAFRMSCSASGALWRRVSKPRSRCGKGRTYIHAHLGPELPIRIPSRRNRHLASRVAIPIRVGTSTCGVALAREGGCT